MPEFHSEPYVYLAGLSHKSALIAWGAFYFKARSEGRMKLVDDDDLQWVHPPRRQTIGATSEKYGPARVEVHDMDGHLVGSAVTNEFNHCVVAGLAPNTRYRYRVLVKGQEWATGERWDWVPDSGGLQQNGGHYRNEFVTYPDPTLPLSAPFSFIVIGDFGSGVRKPSTDKKRQREVADALHRVVARHDVRLILTTGDNIYATRNFLLFTTASGEEDDDWFFTYFQPYRYVLNQVPVCPSIGNHDAAESEDRDDRNQVMDNFYLVERLAGEEVAGRASVGPGLFYRFRVARDVEFICIDTSKEDFFAAGRLFEYPKHQIFVDCAFPRPPADGIRWRIPFCHHPPFCAGPRHHNTRDMAPLVRLFEASGVRACFSGHEHNFQHSRHRGIDYFVTGAGSKIRTGAPDGFADAHTASWAATCHFLLVTIDGSTMTVRAIGEDPAGGIVDIVRRNPSGETVEGPMIVHAGDNVSPQV
jgi:tartrate-resistant acid phosphatase type 5